MRTRWILALLAATVAAGALTAVSALASPSAQVRVGDSFFAAKRLTISRGTRVTWTWRGVLNHNVTVRSGPSRFRSRTQAAGSFTHVFGQPGTYSLYCTIHKFMKMTVVVQ
jgi:plastocyanin